MGTGSIAQLWQQVQHLFQSHATFPFRGFAIDRALATRTGAPPEHYATFATVHERLLVSLAPVAQHHVVLEAGCGTGMDAILLTSRLSGAAGGRYTGFDIAPDNVAWCTANITRRFPNFRFVHLDIQNSTYNPRGSVPATATRFPEDAGVVDRFIAQSVFTHLLPDVADHYLRELRRVLRPDGLALVSCFLGTPDEIAASPDSPAPIFRFAHRYAPGVHVNDPRRPSDSVAYERDVFAAMLAEAGLTLRTFVPGYWALGRAPGEIGQDIVILAAVAAPSR